MLCRLKGRSAEQSVGGVTVKILKFPDNVANRMSCYLYCPQPAVEKYRNYRGHWIWEMTCNLGKRLARIKSVINSWEKRWYCLEKTIHRGRGGDLHSVVSPLNYLRKLWLTYHNRNDQRQTRLLSVNGIMLGWNNTGSDDEL